MALKKNPKFDLKMKYQRMLEVCMIISLALLVIAFKYFPDVAQEEIAIDAPQELVNVEDIVSTKQESAPPPPPKPPIPIEAPTDDVLEDIEIADTELDVDEVIEAFEQRDVKVLRRKLIEITERCIHCGHCITLCPVDAIYRDETDQKVKVGIDKCIQCDRCPDACPVRAIILLK